MPLLVKLMSDEESAVRAAAVGALMNITLDKEGKIQVLQNGGVPAMVTLLDDTNEVCVLNSVKAIANTTELPAAREILQLCAPKLKQIAETAENKILAQSALVAHEAVTWVP